MIFFFAMIGKLYWIYKRRNPKISLTRMGYLPLFRLVFFRVCCKYLIFSTLFAFFILFSGEPWYLRQLLLHKPAASYEDLRTIRSSDIRKRKETATSIRDEALRASQHNVLRHFDDLLAPISEEVILYFNSHSFFSFWVLFLFTKNLAVCCAEETEEGELETFPTFQQACVARGLCTDITEAVIAFSESIMFCTAPQLRGFFVLLTLQGFPTLHIYNVEELRNEMMSDFILEFPGGDIAQNKYIIHKLLFPVLFIVIV